VVDEKDYQNEFNNIDLLIRRGSTSEAQDLLAKIAKQFRSKERVSTPLAPFCQLMLRTGMTDLAFALLRNALRSEPRSGELQSVDLWTEFAMALGQLGLEQESINILMDIPGKKYPQANLYMAFALFRVWNYA
jgi:hypothetical protein